MLTEGQLLTPRYRIVRRLKKGGMGAIYQAFDNTLGVTVAVKENCVEDPPMRAAFQREAELLANLRHPSLPRCSNLLSEGGVQFLIMEFIEGDDLAALMTERRTWVSNETAEDLAWQLLDVLDYIHGEFVLHRDIKPANIKLKDGRAYLLDFGLAYGQSGEMDTIPVGEFNWKYRSKNFSPLEQSKCGRTTPASDLYALAATLYYLLTNVQPTDAQERLEVVSRGGRDPLEDVRVYNPSADECISRAVMQALSISADKRPQSAREMRDMIFPEEAATPERGRVRRLLTARLLSEVLVLGVLACMVFFVLLPQWTGRTSQPPAVPKSTPTPIEPIAEPSPSPAEEAGPLAEEAERQRQSGDDDVAFSKAERAVELDGKNSFAHYVLHDILLDAITGSAEFDERMSEVIAGADRILSLVPSPRSGQEGVARAWANFAKASSQWPHPDPARLDQSIVDANKVLTEYDPNSAAALTIRASATWLRGGPQIDEQTARAVVKDYERVIKLTPEYAQAHANLAKIRFYLSRRPDSPSSAEDLERARLGFEEAIKLTERAGFHQDLGEVYFATGNFEKAADNFGVAARLDPTYSQAHARLGDALFRMGRWANAATSYLAASRLYKTSDNSKGNVLKKLTTACNNLPQSDRAQESCREALKPNQNGGAERKESERARPPEERAAGERQGQSQRPRKEAKHVSTTGLENVRQSLGARHRAQR